MDLWSDNIICKIRRKINNRNVGILDSSIKLNESDCNVVIMKNIRKIVSYLQSVILNHMDVKIHSGYQRMQYRK